MNDELDDDDEVVWSSDTFTPAPHVTDFAGGISSVSETNGLPWSWGISQRRLRQRCTFTRTFE